MTTPLARQHVAVIQRDRACQAVQLGLPGSCSGQLDAAHLIPKVAIKRRHANLTLRLAQGRELTAAERKLATTDLDLILSDPRCAVALCRRGHHQSYDLLGRRGPRERLPERFLEWVAEFVLEVELDRLWRPLVVKGEK